MMIFKKPLHIGWMALGLSVWNLLMYNVPFFQFVASHADMGGWGRLLLLTTLVVVMTALNFLVFYLLLKCLRGVGRGFIALNFVLSALAVYFIINYHVLMDESMMGNVFNTRYSEASAYFRWSLWLFVVLAGVVPALWVCVQKIEWGSWKQMGIFSGASFGVSLLLVLMSLNQVLWVGKYDTELGGLVLPWGYLVNTGRLASHHAAENEEEILLPLGKFENQDKTAVVLVIGESARRANFQLYGYPRSTNPRLKEVKDLQVLQAHSNATYTTAGVRCMLEPKDESSLYEILPNYVSRCGGDVSWRTSNWGEPPVHIAEYLKREELAKQYGAPSDLYDEVLYLGIGERIRQSKNNKVLIILHTSTSHGPDYQMQYPPKHEVYKPVCTRVEDAQKEPDRLMNAYDNTILYTDYCLRNLIDTLRALEGWQTAMLYMSDHGESLGENELYMHGMPMKVAPKEQYEVPLILWTKGDLGEIKKQTEEVDQFCVFHTVIGWLGLQSEAYDADKDLFNRSRKQ